MLDRAGDRVGLAVGSLNSKTLERGVVAAPGSVRPVMAAIAVVIKVRSGGISSAMIQSEPPEVPSL